MKGDSRLVGVVVAAFCLVAMTIGANALSYFPRFVLGGLVMFIGLGFLKDWVVQSWSKLSRSDFAVIIAILVVIETVGFLEGVAAGIMIAAIMFIVNYSRINVVQYVLTGKEIHSNIERPHEQKAVLIHEGGRVLYFKLHGFIFFATSNDLFDKIDQTINESESQVSFVILDFQYVSGIDTSAIHGFVKIKQKALEAGIQLGLSHVHPDIDKLFNAENFADGDAVIDPAFENVDHALEWCEDFILRDSGYDPKIGIQPLSEKLSSIFATNEHRERFVSYLTSVEFSVGDYLYHVHNQTRQIFLIEIGELNVLSEVDEGQEFRLRSVGAGSMVGVANFFRHTQPDAIDTVRAKTDGSAFALSEKDFEKMKIENPAIAMAFQTHVLAFMADRFAESQRALEVIFRTEK
jgi:SulP family sulfate permease